MFARQWSTVALGVFLLVPITAGAATFEYEKSLIQSSPLEDNAYLTGLDVTLTAPAKADVFAGGWSVLASAPVKGDALLAGGSVELRGPVGGDTRIFGGQVHVTDSVGGDLVVVAGSINVTAVPANAWLLGSTVNLTGGAKGPVTIYGSEVTLGGNFSGDVDVFSSDSVTLQDGTTIAGKLRYNAPQEAAIGKDTVIKGGIEYVGKSFLPTQDQARTFALAGTGVFLLVHLLAILIAVGLLAGLFPRLAEGIVRDTILQTPRHFILLLLLGSALIVTTPVLIFLLLISFAGAGVGVLVGSGYVLFMLTGYLGTGIVAGSALAHHLFKRESFSWKYALLGTVVLYLIQSIPFIGTPVFYIIFAATAGSLAHMFYRFAFHREEVE